MARPGPPTPPPGGVTPTEAAALLTDTTDLAAVLDGSWRCRFLNRAGRRILGLSHDHDLDRDPVTLPEFLDEGTRSLLEVTVRPELEHRGLWKGTIVLHTRAGREVPARTTLRRTGDVITWTSRDVSTERAIAQQLASRAFEDPVTGLETTGLLMDRLRLALTRPRPDAGPVTLIHLNLDRFRRVNDNLGHDVGDAVLRAVAQRLRSALPEGVALSRDRADDFLVLVEEGTPEAVRRVRETIDTCLGEPVGAAGRRVHLSASVGVASARPGEVDPEGLRANADAAMQTAKQEGGARWRVFDEAMRRGTERRTRIEEALRTAIEADELEVHFQPEVSLADGTAAGVEALLRWNHPELGAISPAEFIPIAEATNQVGALGAWVLRTALRQAATWERTLVGRPPVVVSVNVSARQMADDRFVELVTEELAASGATPSAVCLELTESVLMEDVDRALETMGRLREAGVRLAIDDFGTGYSSLAYLKRFPVDYVKVDQSFVRGLVTDPEDRAIVSAVVAMARSLGLLSIAEGVEDTQTLTTLRTLGCDLAQGYLFARPRPAGEIEPLLRSRLFDPAGRRR